MRIYAHLLTATLRDRRRRGEAGLGMRLPVGPLPVVFYYKRFRGLIVKDYFSPATAPPRSIPFNHTPRFPSLLC